MDDSCSIRIVLLCGWKTPFHPVRRCSLSWDREELTRRARMNVQPLITILRESASDYLQGTSPGFVDYVLFGRYAYCRMLDARLAQQIWNDQGMEIDQSEF